MTKEKVGILETKEGDDLRTSIALCIYIKNSKNIYVPWCSLF